MTCTATGSTADYALALTKQALQRSAENSMDQQLELEQNLQYLALSSQDYKEGVQAFVENALHNLPDAKESIHENSNAYYRAFRHSLSDYSRRHDVGRYRRNASAVSNAGGWER